MGALSVLEFARAGVGEIRLMDYDSVEPGIHRALATRPLDSRAGKDGRARHFY